MLAIGAAGGVTSIDLFASLGPIALAGSYGKLSASTALGRMEVRHEGIGQRLLRLEDRDPTTVLRLPPPPARAATSRPLPKPRPSPSAPPRADD